jgi:filamentous hemagglutinin family protein
MKSTSLIWVISSLACSHWITAQAITAQIVPDNTLPNASTVEAGCTNCTINGGTRQGNNLFHSFREFSVPTGGEAFFNNAPQIENILTRVTGNSVSNIDGLLRSNGTANLFLINPNGVIFGPNASLNIGGSFVTSTADRLTFPGGHEFSATNPQSPPLLIIDVPIGLQPGRGDIVHSGSLSTRENITLSARNLNVRGQLRAGQDVTLEAQNQLHVQANSTLFSGRDLVFRAPTRLLGNANYTTGGYFITEQANGSVANFLIPHERVVIAEGDVSLPNYQGASLYILAGGRVILGSTTIAPVRSTTPHSFTIGTGTGSTQTVVVNSRSDRSTLDVRSGIDWNRISGLQGNVTPTDLIPTFTPVSGTDINSASIRNPGGTVLLTNQYRAAFTQSVGNISVLNVNTRSSNDGGTISIAATGNITTNEGFVTNSPLAAGNISLLSDGDVLLRGSIDTGGEGLGRPGDIQIRAQAVNITNSQVFSGNPGATRGGDIRIQAQTVNVTNSQFFNGTTGSAPGGNIQIQAQIVNLNNSQISASTGADVTSTGPGGDVSIQADVVNLLNGSAVRSVTNGAGQGGEITINATLTLELSGVSPRTSTPQFPVSSRLIANTFSQGDAGSITISTGRLILRDAAIISSSSGVVFSPEILSTTSSGYVFGQREELGRGGRVTIDATSIEMSGAISEDSLLFTNISTSTSSTGRAGNLTINTDRLSLASGAVLTTATLGYFEGAGRSGNLAITARESIDLAGRSVNGQIASSLSTDSFGFGEAGSLAVNTNHLILRDGAAISASAYGPAQGGSIRINANRVDVTGAGIPSDALASGIYAQTFANGNAGDITISTNHLRVSDRATVTTAADTITNSRGPVEFLRFLGFPTINTVIGNAGRLTITANSVELNSAGSIRASTIASSGGRITLQGLERLQLNNGEISASTVTGEAGQVQIEAVESVQLQGRGGLFVRATEDGNAGDLAIATNQFRVQDGATASVSSLRGEAGSLRINAEQVSLDQGSLTAVTGSRNGGNIAIRSSNLVMRNRSEISAAARHDASGGNITLDIREGFVIAVPEENSDIIAIAEQGNGGRIDITAQQIIGFQQSEERSPLSEINASSEFGSAGTILLNTPDVDPSRGLAELPADVTDAANLVAIDCSPTATAQANQGEFYRTGRGGIAPLPTDVLGSSDILEDLQPPASWATSTSPSPPVMEAQGWQTNDRGEVELVASTPQRPCER